MKARVLLLGWDGAEPGLVEPWVAQRRLPALADLAARGALGRVRSTLPAVTPPAWTTLMTGLNPGRHGIYSFTRPAPGGYAEELVTAAERQAPSIWQYLSEAGRIVGVFNLSLTYPPEPVSGFLFAGFDAPVFGPRLAHPAEAFALATRGLSGYIHEGLDKAHGADAAGALSRQLRQQRDMLLNLTRAYPVDVLAVNFNTPDHIHHHAWPLGQTAAEVAASTGSPVERAYRDLDAVLADVLAEYVGDDTQVILVSDHGGGRMLGQVSLSRALEAGGFLVRTARRRAGALGRLRRIARQVLPHRLKVRLWSLAGERFRLEMAQRLRASQVAGVAWERTVAFSWGSSGFVQVNLQGREPSGCVAPGDRDRVLTEISDYLRTLRDPATGQPVIGAIHRAEEIFAAPRVGYCPDLLVEGAGEEYSVMPWWEGGGGSDPEAPVCHFSTRADTPRGVTANHRSWGVLATAGPAVAPGASVPELGLADLAPALLYLAGAPLPADLDGRLERRLWNTGEEPVAGASSAVLAGPEPTYSAEEEAAVERRLADLGYM